MVTEKAGKTDGRDDLFFKFILFREPGLTIPATIMFKSVSQFSDRLRPRRTAAHVGGGGGEVEFQPSH